MHGARVLLNLRAIRGICWRIAWYVSAIDMETHQLEMQADRRRRPDEDGGYRSRLTDRRLRMAQTSYWLMRTDRARPRSRLPCGSCPSISRWSRAKVLTVSCTRCFYASSQGGGTDTADMGILGVEVLSAHNLLAADRGGKSDVSTASRSIIARCPKSSEVFGRDEGVNTYLMHSPTSLFTSTGTRSLNQKRSKSESQNVYPACNTAAGQL